MDVLEDRPLLFQMNSEIMSHFTSYEIMDWDKPFEKCQKLLESPHGF